MSYSCRAHFYADNNNDDDDYKVVLENRTKKKKEEETLLRSFLYSLSFYATLASRLFKKRNLIMGMSEPNTSTNNSQSLEYKLQLVICLRRKRRT